MLFMSRGRRFRVLSVLPLQAEGAGLPARHYLLPLETWSRNCEDWIKRDFPQRALKEKQLPLPLPVML